MASFDVVIDGVDFGEGPRWHDGRLWYSDFYQHSVYAVSSDGRRERIVEVPTQPSGLGWQPDGTLLIVSMIDRRVLRWDGASLELHADLAHLAGFHCNDMVVAADGTAYVGNFGWDLFTLGIDGACAATLAGVRPDGSVFAAAEEMLFPNGSVITPDGSTLIVGETLGARYTAFTIGADGSLSDRRLWADLEGYAPDGCTLDAEGGIWCADAIGSRLVRVVEGGAITHTIDTGVGTFACMLGGDDGRTLFVLTAPGSSPEEVAGKAAGAILATTVDIPHAGLP